MLKVAAYRLVLNHERIYAQGRWVLKKGNWVTSSPCWLVLDYFDLFTNVSDLMVTDTGDCEVSLWLFADTQKTVSSEHFCVFQKYAGFSTENYQQPQNSVSVCSSSVPSTAVMPYIASSSLPRFIPVSKNKILILVSGIIIK